MGMRSDRPLAKAFESLLQSPESIEYAVVDAFVGGQSKGNPAAVVLLAEWKDDKWLQDVAAEFNLPTTAYIVKKEKNANGTTLKQKRRKEMEKRREAERVLIPSRNLDM